MFADASAFAGHRACLHHRSHRLIALALGIEAAVDRPAVRAARASLPRSEVVAALATEIDALQQQDRERVERYQRAAAPFLRQVRESMSASLPLAAAHEQIVSLAEHWLPENVLEECTDGTAE